MISELSELNQIRIEMTERCFFIFMDLGVLYCWYKYFIDLLIITETAL